MPESGESSQKLPRKGGLSLFRRFFQANTARSRREALRSPVPAPGDVCQISSTAPPKNNQSGSKFGFNGLARLFGKLAGNANSQGKRRGRKSPNLRLDPRPVDRQTSASAIRTDSPSRTDSENLNSRFVPISERRAALNQQNGSRKGDGRNGNGRTNTGRVENGRTDLGRTDIGRVENGRNRDKRAANNRETERRNRLATASVSSRKSTQSLDPVPFSRQREQADVGRNGRGAKSTQTLVQAGQTTSFQTQPTALQHETTLQNQNGAAPTKRRAVRRRPQVPAAPSRPRSRSMAIALYAARMLILSVGIGVLAGTVLSAWNPANNPFLADGSQTIKQASSAPFKSNNASGQIQVAQEIAPLKASIQGLLPQYSGLTPGIFLVDLDTNNYVDLSGNTSFSAASMIKLPVLVAFFQEVDAGRIRLDEKLTLRKEMIGEGSGELQGYPPGSQFTALDVATKMITLSDNTATNMLIDKLGGVAAVNERLKSWSLSATSLNSILPDLQGTNTTSPKEMANILVRISQGELVSLKSRDRLLDIMRRTINNSQLPPGLGDGATIAHKTGDIGKLIGDVGLVDMPNGKRYAIAVIVKCPFNDSRAYDLVQKISRLTYQNLSGGAVASTATPTSTPSAETQESSGDANTSITPERSPASTNSGQN